MRKRFDEIDLLRAFGILGVIIVHILTYNLTNPIYKFLWNNLQFVVVSFVFCSGFVLASIYENAFSDLHKTILWYKKRFIRLVFPFWIYLIAHFSLWILFPNFFQGLGLVKTPQYFLNSALFIGGTNLNWLPLLFLQLTFYFPIFINLFSFKRKIFWIYSLAAVFITAIFTFYTFPYSHYREVMWIPWSLVLITSMVIAIQAKKEEKSIMLNSKYLIYGLIFFGEFLVLLFINFGRGNSLNFYDHKYPPDFYYIFFGLAFTCFSLLIGRAKIWQNVNIKKVYFYISNNSYQIFFIHYILLDMVLTLAKKNTLLQNPILEFAIILPLSLLLAEIFNRTTSLLKRKS